MTPPDRVVLEISLSLEEHETIEAIVRERGYPTPGDYVRALIAFDAQSPDEVLDDEDEIDLAASFRQA
jgi:hypothetical protein